VNGPAVIWATHGICVPELRLEQGAAGRIEAAKVSLHSSVVAGLLSSGWAGFRGVDVEDAPVGRVIERPCERARREEDGEGWQHGLRCAKTGYESINWQCAKTGKRIEQSTREML
jgi:hypothetical protein